MAMKFVCKQRVFIFQTKTSIPVTFCPLSFILCPSHRTRPQSKNNSRAFSKNPLNPREVLRSKLSPKSLRAVRTIA